MSSLLSILRRTEARFGLTRADVTVALFLASAALIGFTYTRFFEAPQEIARRTELLQLAGRHDSIVEARNASMIGEFALPSDSDSVAMEWEPLTEDEVLDEGTSGSGTGRSKKLALKDVAPVNINTAPSTVLELLPGVGEKTAEKIVEYRQEKPFRRIEDIMNVKGIGPKKFAEMKSYIVVGGGAAGTGSEERHGVADDSINAKR